MRHCCPLKLGWGISRNAKNQARMEPQRTMPGWVNLRTSSRPNQPPNNPRPDTTI